MQQKNIRIIGIAFLLSILIRIPNLDRPLSKHHEFITAHLLRIMEIWQHDGISTHRFLPVMNYWNTADKHIRSGASNVKDEKGNYFYLSYPPLGYYVPYLFISPFGITPMNLQLFNMLLHLVGVLLITRVTLLFTQRDKIALYAAIAYIFNPCALWFHSNVYMVDMLAQVFFLLGIYAAYFFFNQGKKIGLLYLSVILLNYTEWLGAFFSVTLLLLFLIHRKKINHWFVHVIILSIATLLPIVVTIYQYASIQGLESYLASAQERLGVRSGYDNSWMEIVTGWLYLIRNYITGFLPILLFIGYTVIRNRKLIEINGLFVTISMVPILLHHIIFLNFSGHDFSVLKSSVFIAVLFGISVILIQKHHWIWLTSIVFLCIGQYYYINRPGTVSIKGDRYDQYQKIGETVQSMASEEEVIFMQGNTVEQQHLYYAKRNIQSVSSKTEAVDFLLHKNRQKGVIFKVKNNQIIDFSRIEL